MEGWRSIPMPGAKVKSSHPRTVINPDEFFHVISVRVEGDRVYVRGENTCWFNADMITPAPADTANK